MPDRLAWNRSSVDRKRMIGAVTAAGTKAQASRWPQGAIVRIARRNPHSEIRDDRQANSIKMDDSTNSSNSAAILELRIRMAPSATTLTASSARKITPILQQSGITISIG